MNEIQALLENIMFVVGIVLIGAYALMWLVSPRLRREIEKPKYRMLERDDDVWKQDP